MNIPTSTFSSRVIRGFCASKLLLLLLLQQFSGSSPSLAEPPARVAVANGVQGVSDAAPWVSDPEQRAQLFELGVKPWFERGYFGQGMKVAILDSGFQGYRAFLGKGLPVAVQVQSFRKDGNLEARASQHGMLCAEVIHTLAPEAKLLFANWEPNEPATFLEAVRWARRQGAQLVSCSCIMPNWSDGEGGGAIHEELTRILGTGKNQGDMVFFGCVGNTARRHWHGSFQPDANGFQQWSNGQRDNELKPWGSGQVSVELYCRPGAKYELFIHDHTTGTEAAHTMSSYAGGICSSAARFDPQANHAYTVRLRLAEGKGGPFHLTALQSDLGRYHSEGSICFPGDGGLVIAVGAVDRNGLRKAYSACGPNSGLPKPDLVAPVPFISHLRKQHFAGTSAADPDLHAIASTWIRQTA